MVLMFDKILEMVLEFHKNIEMVLHFTKIRNGPLSIADLQKWFQFFFTKIHKWSWTNSEIT